MSVLGNFIKLVEGVPKRLHFIDHSFQQKTLMDPVLGRPKTLTSLSFLVDEEDGSATSKTFSVTSEKLAARLQPWLEARKYVSVNVTITQRGRGFLTDYEVAFAAR